MVVAVYDTAEIEEGGFHRLGVSGGLRYGGSDVSVDMHGSAGGTRLSMSVTADPHNVSWLSRMDASADFAIPARTVASKKYELNLEGQQINITGVDMLRSGGSFALPLSMRAGGRYAASVAEVAAELSSAS